MYFHEGTEQAIVDYNATDDWREKNAIYNANLRQPFEKLVENIIHTFKFYYFDIPLEDVKHEVISFMITRLGKYKHDDAKKVVYEDKEMMQEQSKAFFGQIIAYWEDNIEKVFKKDRDLTIAWSVIELMSRVDSIEIFNKKALYILLRELSGAKTQHITKVLNTMKSHYSNMEKQWNENGQVGKQRTYNQFMQ
jgi:hypothetical protein